MKKRTRTMTYARGARTLATAVLLLVAVTSCADDGNDPSASKSPAPSLPAPNITTSMPPSESQIASGAASSLVRKYYATVDKLSQHDAVALDELSAVATSIQLSAQRALLRSQRARGERQTGDTRIAQLMVQSVDLDNSDPDSGKVPTILIDVCWDVTEVDVVDAKGKSVVSPGRPASGWTRLRVANYHYTAHPTGGWRVATGQDLKQKPCAVS